MDSTWNGARRIFGVTMGGTDDSLDDGTGLNPLDAAAALAELPQKPMVRLVLFRKIPLSVYVDKIRTLKAAGARILLLVVDSYGMAQLSITQFRTEHQKARDVLGPELDEHDIVECGNEVSGARGDDVWPGPFAYQKARTALLVWSGHPAKRLITYFLTLGDMAWVTAWLAQYSMMLQAEIVGWSIYPRGAPHSRIPSWQQLMAILAQYNSGSDLIISEYGSQNGQGHIDWHVEQQLVANFEGRPKAHERDIGGNFNWNGYAGLVQNGKLLTPFQRAWGNS